MNMKKIFEKSRKGLTLVELLFVIIILGALAATMMLSSGNSVVNAKAETIVSNMTKIKDAIWFYFAAEHYPDFDGFKKDAKKYLGDIAKPNGNVIFTVDNLTYEVWIDGEDKGGHWKVQCNFTKDPDRDALKKKFGEIASNKKIKLYYKEIKNPYTGGKSQSEYKVLIIAI